MSVYKVVAGRHKEKDVVYKKGDVIETDTDLVRLFGEKFELVGETPAPKKKEEAASTTTEPKVVTDAFEGAEAEELVVHQVGRKYYVYENDDLETPIEGGNGVGKKKAAASIANYIE